MGEVKTHESVEMHSCEQNDDDVRIPKHCILHMMRVVIHESCEQMQWCHKSHELHLCVLRNFNWTTFPPLTYYRCVQIDIFKISI